MKTRERLETALQDFLSGIGIEEREKIHAGEGEALVVSPAQRRKLIERLKSVRQDARFILNVRLGLMIAVFVLLCMLVAYYRDNIAFVSASCISGGATVWMLLRQFSELHRRSVATDLLIAMLPDLPLNELPKVLMALLDEIRMPESIGQPVRNPAS